MTYSIPLATTATRTKLRTPGNVSPFSGMCSVCVEGCGGSCEIGRSAIRGTEFLYPISNDQTQTASEKDYPVDFSHFNINGAVFGASGIEADSDQAIFSNVNLETEVGMGTDKIKLKAPFVFPAVAKLNWVDYYTGAALAGVIAVIGEDAVSRDPEAEIKNGRLYKSPQLQERIKAFTDYYNGYGAIFLQANVDDEKLGLLEYAVGELGLDAVELKLGQGSKGIQGIVTLPNLAKALEAQSNGYVVYPDPSDPQVQANYEHGTGPEFLKIYRLPMWDEEYLGKRIEQLRRLGAKYVALKIGPFRPANLARIAKFSCQSGIDILTADSAGGGTGWSPWKMMNEWGLPAVYLESLLYEFFDTLKQQHVNTPSLAIAGGFALEDQIFKGLALGAPHVNLIGMCRAPMAAAMVGKTVGKMIEEGNIPKEYEQYGCSVEQIYAGSRKLKGIYGDKFAKISPGAMGVFNYVERITTGLRQLMALARKFSLQHITRDDIFALTREAAEVSSIKQFKDMDRDEIKHILNIK